PSRTTASPTGGAGCTATYVKTNEWPGGFGVTVTVTNGSAATTAWTVTWTFANGQQITQLWSGVYTQTGANVTVNNADYNGTLAPNASTTFGFNGSWSGTNTNPTTVTCTRS